MVSCAASKKFGAMNWGDGTCMHCGRRHRVTHDPAFPIFHYDDGMRKGTFAAAHIARTQIFGHLIVDGEEESRDWVARAKHLTGIEPSSLVVYLVIDEEDAYTQPVVKVFATEEKANFFVEGGKKYPNGEPALVVHEWVVE